MIVHLPISHIPIIATVILVDIQINWRAVVIICFKELVDIIDELWSGLRYNINLKSMPSIILEVIIIIM